MGMNLDSGNPNFLTEKEKKALTKIGKIVDANPNIFCLVGQDKWGGQFLTHTAGQFFYMVFIMESRKANEGISMTLNEGANYSPKKTDKKDELSYVG